MGNENSDVNVDIEFFINEVKIHREIWDIKSEDYKDREKKQSAWQEVCGSLVEDFSRKSKKEKDVIIKKLALKWKNLKDNYARSLRKKAKSGSGRQYIYTRQLSFLQELMTLSTTQPTIENSDSVDSPLLQSTQEEDVSLSDPVTSPTESVLNAASSGADRTTSKRQRELESSLINFINSSVAIEPPDEDKAFFDSLIPTIKKFSDDQKLDFRSEVLDIVKRIKRQKMQPAQLKNTQISPDKFPLQMYVPIHPQSQQQVKPFVQLINFPPPQQSSSMHCPVTDSCFTAMPSATSSALLNPSSVIAKSPDPAAPLNPSLVQQSPSTASQSILSTDLNTNSTSSEMNSKNS